MMTAEQRYTFDVQGYLVLERVLPPEQVKRMVADMSTKGIRDPENDPGASRFGGFLAWGDDWRELIDHPAVLPVLTEIIGPHLRLDHAYGMAMSVKGKRGGEGLHHHAGMFDYGCFYATHGQQMHNGLVVVSYALTDILPGAGGFCCIPGSHKALYKTPEGWFDIDKSPLARQIPQNAGDVLIFTESLTHGTAAWTNPEAERRSVLLKYTPGYMQWAKQPMNAEKITGLTDRQRLILQGPSVHERTKVTVDGAP